MMKIQSYDDMKIDLLDATVNPGRILRAALDITMKKNINLHGKVSSKTCKFLITAEHMSLLEHCKITIQATGISRSLLAQLTRQRTFSFTSASQHYQDYRMYPCIVHGCFAKGKGLVPATFRETLKECIKVYSDLVDFGMKPEEARQLLPSATAVNLIITADACNLVKFFRARRCNRNVQEMITFADKLHGLCLDWWPELFQHVGAPCFMDGKCNQGHLMCEERRMGEITDEDPERAVKEEICLVCARVHEEGESCI